MSSSSAQPIIEHWDFPDDQQASEIYIQLLSELAKYFEDIQNEKFSVLDFDHYFERLAKEIGLNPWGLFRVFHDGKVCESAVVSSSLNTALVTAIFVRVNQWDADKAKKITRAALLHDVGMLFIDQSILEKKGRLTERERALLESHPARSYERVKKWGESYEATQVALQHHEDWSGTGYPSQLKGHQIHPWTSIVSLALNFVARVTQRVYRNSLVGYEAMKILIKNEKLRFNPTVVKDFVRSFGLNAPGSILLLSDGSIARVLEITQDHLLRPKVRLLIDQYGNAFRQDVGSLIDLTSKPQLFIARPVNFQDLINVSQDPV